MSQMISRRSDSFRIQAQSAPATDRAGELLLVLPRALLRAMRRAWIVHKEERLLQELSDYQLRDLGISRGQIPHVVRDGWNR